MYVSLRQSGQKQRIVVYIGIYLESVTSYEDPTNLKLFYRASGISQTLGSKRVVLLKVHEGAEVPFVNRATHELVAMDFEQPVRLIRLSHPSRAQMIHTGEICKFLTV